MNAHESRQPSLDFPPLALAYDRIAVLRTEADRARLGGAGRAPRRGPSWPAGVVAALRESIAGALPASRAVVRREPCTTC
jgi:hypothetical protein